MATNVEIKARVRDAERFRELAEDISHSKATVLGQEDVFFGSPGGRLKLRLLSPSDGQLIYYERPDGGGPRRSDYFMFETSDPASLQGVLGPALGVRGTVKKRRSLYMVGGTRIHLDEVEGLGTFAEIEVVLGPDQSTEEGVSIATNLMRSLGVDESDLEAAAYIDLLEARKYGTSTDSGHQATDTETV